MPDSRKATSEQRGPRERREINRSSGAQIRVGFGLSRFRETAAIAALLRGFRGIGSSQKRPEDGMLISRFISRRSLSNLTVRVMFAAVAVPILIYLLFLAPRWGFLLLLVSACVVSAIELFSMIAPKSLFYKGWGILTTTAVFSLLVFNQNPSFFFPGIISLVLAGMLVGLAAARPIEKAALIVGWSICAPVYLGGMLGALGLLFARDNGGAWVLFAAMISWFGDTGGYFGGRFFGSRKLCPPISPQKTVEGAFCGLLASTSSVLFAHFGFLPALPLLSGLVLALFSGILAQLGDLTESLIKRSTGVKDAGWIIPGHGGLLDRIDSLLFVSAAIWIYVELL
jgi:phosphatidate cytidylyltransferase